MMRRLVRILALVAALGGGAALLGCPLFHGDYPPSNGTCSKNTECLLGESCSDAGVCEPGAQTDASEQQDAGGQG